MCNIGHPWSMPDSLKCDSALNFEHDHETAGEDNPESYEILGNSLKFCASCLMVTVLSCIKYFTLYIHTWCIYLQFFFIYLKHKWKHVILLYY